MFLFFIGLGASYLSVLKRFDVVLGRRRVNRFLLKQNNTILSILVADFRFVEKFNLIEIRSKPLNILIYRRRICIILNYTNNLNHREEISE